MIPRKIHYCWFGGNPLTELAEKCIRSWREHCPDYEIVRWDESNFDVEANRYAREAYRAGMWAFVSDYARLRIIYEHGGVYLDTDVELLKSIDPLMEYPGFMGFESEAIVAPGLGFGAEKGNRIVLDLMRQYEDISFVNGDGSLDLTTIPRRATKLLIEKGLAANNTMQEVDGMVFLPTEYLCPMIYATGNIVVTDNTFAIHHFGGSWKTEEQKFWIVKKRRYRRMLGRWFGKRMFKLDRAIRRTTRAVAGLKWTK